MIKPAVLAVGLAVGVGAWYALRRHPVDGLDFTALSSSGGLGDSIAGAFVKVSQGLGFMPYTAAISLKKNQAYVEHIRSVEKQIGLPRDMLLRLAFQESGFIASTIAGTNVSKAGAKGMFQLMPVHWKRVDPVDWKAAAFYAGRYLLSLHKRFGSWLLALAAYNWGQGNLAKYGIARAPLETRKYYKEILADVGGGFLYA